jgi:hypothetical protein
MAALACGIAAGCGGSPTAPSVANATDPVAIVSTPPTPAPVSQTLTGTWYLDGRNFMTLTQDGSSVTGMPSPATFDAGNGVTVAESGTISGLVDGEHVTLALIERITVNGMGPRVICTAGHTFTGELSGNTLSGTVIAGTTPLTCDGGDLPAIALRALNGPTIFSRQ